MSRDDGFALMDVSTAIHNDPKFKRLKRAAPDKLPAAFMVYVATLAESWREGCRVVVDDAWPALLDFDADLADELVAVGLLDEGGFIPEQVWGEWFAPANARRQRSRERWARYNANRNADTTEEPRGSDVGTATSVPTVRPSGPTDRPSDDGRDDLEAFLIVKHRPPTKPQRDLMDNYCRVFDVTGPARAAQLIYAHPDDPIGALKADLDAFRKERAAAAPIEAEPTRRGPSASVITAAHNNGYHEGMPDERCRYCQEGAA